MIEKRCPACNDILFRGRIERGVIELLCKQRDCPDRRKLRTFVFPERRRDCDNPKGLRLATV